MTRYFMQLSYKGTNFHGWQRQKNASSIQQALEKAISTVLREKITVTGAGRTDTGVHAKFFVAHFDTSKDFDADLMVKKLNGLTPPDIVIYKIFQPPVKAHARFDAISRTYKYFVHTRPNPFISEFSYYLYWTPNIEKMNQAAQILLEYEDFKAFSKAHSGTKHYLCKLYQAYWEQNGDKFIFTVKANRFLRNMVRAIVGTLLDVGKGRIDLKEFRKIIETRNRRAASLSAPANGLFLVDIQYPEHIEKFLDKDYEIFWQSNI